MILLLMVLLLLLVYPLFTGSVHRSLLLDASNCIRLGSLHESSIRLRACYTHSFASLGRTNCGQT